MDSFNGNNRDNEGEGSLSFQLSANTNSDVPVIEIDQRHMRTVMVRNANSTVTSPRKVFYSKSPHPLNKSIDVNQDDEMSSVPAMSLISHNESSCCDLIESARRDEFDTMNTAANNTSISLSDGHLNEQQQQQSSSSNDNNNLLKPLNRDDGNNSSQSSLDTRIRYGDDVDLVPLVKLNGKSYFKCWVYFEKKN